MTKNTHGRPIYLPRSGLEVNYFHLTVHGTIRTTNLVGVGFVFRNENGQFLAGLNSV
jgi:hypothetical protein